MVGWHHRLNRHEFEQTPGGNEGQGSLACCSLWGPKELDVTEQLNNNNLFTSEHLPFFKKLLHILVPLWPPWSSSLRVT